MERIFSRLASVGFMPLSCNGWSTEHMFCRYFSVLQLPSRSSEHVAIYCSLYGCSQFIESQRYSPAILDRLRDKAFGPFIVKPFLTVSCSEPICMGLVVSFFVQFKETPFWENHYTISASFGEFLTYFGFISASSLSPILCTL